MATNSNEIIEVLRTYIKSHNLKSSDIVENVNEEKLNYKTGLRLDLHGYSIPKAKAFTIEMIKKVHANENVQVIHVITGRGKHPNSHGTRGVLFKELQEWVKIPEIAPLIKEVKQNNGAYLIVLNKSYKKLNENNLYQLKENVLRELAESGNKDAQFALGKRLFEKENKESQDWLLKAAQQGHVEAMVLIGYSHGMGRNAQYSPKEAMRWYQQAALNSAEACINLGIMYGSGEAGLVDAEQAIYWYKQAEKLGSIMAQRLLGIEFFRLKCYEEAAIWNHKASEGNDHPAQVNLGVMYQEGLGVTKDEKRAIKLFESAAKGGIDEGKMRLGLAYLNGIGVDKDYETAAKLFLEVGLLNQGSVGADCQFFLYCMYKEGLGFKPNVGIAQQWLQRAANNNHAEALALLKSEINSKEEKSITSIHLKKLTDYPDLAKKMECLEVNLQKSEIPEEIPSKIKKLITVRWDQETSKPVTDDQRIEEVRTKKKVNTEFI